MKSGIRIIQSMMRQGDERRRKANEARALQEHMRIALEAYVRRVSGSGAVVTSAYLQDVHENPDGSVEARVVPIASGRSN